MNFLINLKKATVSIFYDIKIILIINFRTMLFLTILS